VGDKVIEIKMGEFQHKHKQSYTRKNGSVKLNGHGDKFIECTGNGMSGPVP
jgi:hypothetical protein